MHQGPNTVSKPIQMNLGHIRFVRIKSLRTRLTSEKWFIRMLLCYSDLTMFKESEILRNSAILGVTCVRDVS